MTLAKSAWDCMEVLAVEPMPRSRVGVYQITYRTRSGAILDWTVTAKDELDAFNKVDIVSE